MAVNNKQNGRGDDDDEPEMTLDTPDPVSVEPPVETNFIATPVASTAVDVTASLRHTTCTVFAPATLEAGYTFPCRVDGIDFVVTVPEGGVTEGQAFQVPYPTSPAAANANHQGSTSASSSARNNSINPLEVESLPNFGATTMKWRNDIWDCFEVLHTGIFWQGWCCTPLLLGQVMTRNKLNVFGIPSDDSYQSTFYILAALWGTFVLLLILIVVLNNALSFVVVWPIFMMIITANTRHTMRRRYRIPTKCCSGYGGRCDDFCCGLWCTCCVTIQMARHTHPHNEYPYNCCSPTGLSEGVADNV